MRDTRCQRTQLLVPFAVGAVACVVLLGDAVVATGGWGGVAAGSTGVLFPGGADEVALSGGSGCTSTMPPPLGLVGAVASGFSVFLGSIRSKLASCAPWSMTQKVNAPSSRSTPARARVQRPRHRRELCRAHARMRRAHRHSI